jgi:hypothetical protein
MAEFVVVYTAGCVGTRDGRQHPVRNIARSCVEDGYNLEVVGRARWQVIIVFPSRLTRVGVGSMVGLRFAKGNDSSILHIVISIHSEPGE